ncbi:sulfate adenylyltransferase [Candidatus Saccharibacteria bacterium]|nr:sulfate adenylyltransferase [Calditrichia bacterium]NIV97861.1 sulfate adenylyltransferase [Candidatus Saccharibacteria bacterium]NIW78147.1 sulfate adenylyltransferase [Calditrichia bacterium]
MIKPHGGNLINRYANDAERQQLIEKAENYPSIILDDKNISDLEMIACGAMSPLTGFMTSKDYHSVVENMHLSNGLVWSIPITLAVDDETMQRIRGESQVALYDHDQHLLALMQVEEIFSYDKKVEAKNVFRTEDEHHPGVSYVYAQGNHLVGGEITMLNRPNHENFLDHRRDPAHTRKIFSKNGWETVVAFQTRNPIHRAHEYLQKCALEIVDGLLIHPLVGRTKSDDISAEIRMQSYEVLLEKYYPKGRYLLSVFPAAMRYAGPREAIFHALVRKNYGCTHFIIGRDHAGVGDYYGTYDAQHIFKEFSADELDITPLFFEHAFFCTTCDNMASAKTCPHDKSQHVFLSGTKVRQLLKNGELPPKEFSRPEVAELLMKAMRETQ